LLAGDKLRGKVVYNDGDEVRAAKGTIREAGNMVIIDGDGFILKIPIQRVYKIEEKKKSED